MHVRRKSGYGARGLVVAFSLAWGVFGAAGSAVAQLPAAELKGVFPPGGKQGTAFDATIVGEDLDGPQRLVFSHPGIVAEPKVAAPSEFQSPRPLPNQFTVKIAADVPPGQYEARLAGKYGVSNPRSFVVGASDEIVEAEPNNDAKSATPLPLGAVANGTADGEGVDFFKFSAQGGARLIVECRAYRIDSRMDPTLVVLDANGSELARGRDDDRRDCVVDFVAPADGEYFVKLYDFTFRGGLEYFYRLTISAGPRVDFVIPPAGLPGTKNKHLVYGRNLPGGAPSPWKLGERPLEQVEVEIETPADPAAREKLPGALVEPQESGLDGFEFRLAGPGGPSNPVTLYFAAAPVVLEQEPNDHPSQSQKIALPCEVAGQFAVRGDVDRFTFDAQQGDTYWIEVYSRRLGVPTDPYLLIERVTKDDQGQEQSSVIAEADDDGVNLGGQNYRAFSTVSDDPVLKFVAPAAGTYRLVLRDLYNRARGNPRFVYRLALRKEQPDFRLVAVGESSDRGQNQDPSFVPLAGPVVRRGGAAGIQVLAFRRDGFDGEIEIAAEGLPPGVSAAPIRLSGGATSGTMVFAAEASAAEWFGQIKVVGRSTIGGAQVSREARPAAVVHGAQNNQEPARARLAQALSLAVVGEAAPALIRLGEGQVWEMARGGRLEIAVTIARAQGFSAGLNLQTRSQPQGVNFGNTNLGGGNEGKLQVNIQGNANPGVYTIGFFAQTQLNGYRRNLEAAAAAQEEKKAIDKLAADLAAAAQQAQQAKQAAEKGANDAAAAAKQAADAVTAADREVQQSQQQASAAAAKAAEAKSAAEKKPEDQGLAAAAAAAQKEAEEAAARLRAMQEKKAAAEKASQEAQGKAKVAADAKAAAEKTAQEASDRARRAEQVKQTVAQQVQALVNQSNPRQVNVTLVATPLVLRITPSPVTIAAGPPSGELAQGGKIELPVTLTRLYNYNDAVEIAWVNQNAPGVRAQNITIPAGQTQGKLVFEANKDASPGDRTLTIEARVRFNGQNVPVRQDLAIKVVPAK